MRLFVKYGIILFLMAVGYSNLGYSVEVSKLKENAKKFSNPKEVFKDSLGYLIKTSEKCNPEVAVDIAIESGFAKRLKEKDVKKTEGKVCLDCGGVSSKTPIKAEHVLAIAETFNPQDNKHCKDSKGKLLYNCKNEVRVRFAVDWVEALPELANTQLVQDIAAYKKILNRYDEVSFQWALELHEKNTSEATKENKAILEASIKETKSKLEKDMDDLSSIQFEKLIQEANERTQQRIEMDSLLYKIIEDWYLLYIPDSATFNAQYPNCGASEMEFDLLKSYIAQGFLYINPTLWIADANLSKSKEAEVLVYALMNGLRGLPKFYGIVGRGVDGLPKSVMEEHVVGNTVLNKALTSTGRNGGFVYRSLNAFVIFSKDGRSLQGINPMEQEVLFAPYQKFEVLHREDNVNSRNDASPPFYQNQFVMVDQGNKVGWEMISKDWSEFLKSKDQLKGFKLPEDIVGDDEE